MGNVNRDKYNGFNTDLFFEMVIGDVLSSAISYYYEKSVQENKYDFLEKAFKEHVEINLRKDGNVFWGTNEEVNRFIQRYTQVIEKYRTQKN